MSISTPDPIYKRPRGRREWSEEEDAIVLDYYMELDISELVRLLPWRSVSAIRRRASNLGVANGSTSWTEEEDARLRENYRDYNNPRLAELFPNRTINAVRGRVFTLGLNRMWTEEEDSALLESYTELDFGQLQELLPGRTREAIMHRASVLGCAGKATGRGAILTVEARAIGEISGYIRRGAEVRGYVFELSEERVADLIAQPCHYCGLSPEGSNQWNVQNRGSYFYNGIDRVNSAIGYVEGNVVSCCATCNRAKNAQSLEEFREWIQRAYHHMFGNE